MTLYRKAFAALAGAVVVTLAAATSDDVITAAEMVQVVMSALGAFAVYVTPNLPGHTYAKTIVSAAMAGFGLLGGYLATGEEITTAMWLNVALAVGTAAGVFLLPNKPEALPPG